MLVSLLGPFGIVGAYTPTALQLTPDGCGVSFELCGNTLRIHMGLNTCADVVSFPQREMIVCLHMLDSLVGEKSEATKLHVYLGG